MKEEERWKKKEKKGEKNEKNGLSDLANIKKAHGRGFNGSTSGLGLKAGKIKTLYQPRQEPEATVTDTEGAEGDKIRGDRAHGGPYVHDSSLRFIQHTHCLGTRKSTSGGCLMLGARLVKSWSSTKPLSHYAPAGQSSMGWPTRPVLRWGTMR